MKRLAAVLMSLLLYISALAGPAAYGCYCEELAPPAIEEPEGDAYPVSPMDDMPDSKLDMN